MPPTIARRTIRIRVAVASLLALGGSLPASAQECQPEWAPNAGLDSIGTAYALAEFDAGDGSGPTLFVGGGIAGFVQRWNGAAWQPLPSAPTAEVRGMTVTDLGAGPSLFATGEFNTAGGAPVSGVARFDGAAWHALGGGISGFGLCIEPHADANGPGLVVGGSFTMASGLVVNRIARWNGTEWSALGAGMNGPVESLLVVPDGPLAGLYAGGSFTTAGGAAASRVARWNGAAWTPLGAGLNGSVRALALHDDGDGPAIYAAGSITESGLFVVRRWDGASWTTVGATFNGTHRSLRVHDDGSGSGPALHVAGDFTLVGDAPPVAVGRLARLEATGWRAAGPALSSSAIEMLETSLFGAPSLMVAGSFTSAGGIPSKSVARRTGCMPAATADFNGDGVVDGDDLGTLLGAWGPCAGCMEDLDGDGAVDGDDLGTLLGAWSS